MQWKNKILSLGLLILSALLWFIALYLLLRA